MANHTPEVFSTDDPELATAMEGHDAGHTEHVDPAAFGLIGPAAWVSLAMLAFVGILVWKGVPKLITRGLDGKIAAIREQLDEARKLRAEAEALRAEYAAKIAGAEKDAAAMLEHARHEADLIVAKAAADTETVIARRQRMAEDKIAAAERAAVDDVRARAAGAAAVAAHRLISDSYGEAADRTLVDQTISAL